MTHKTYKELTFDRLEKVFHLIDEAMSKFGIPYYLIGAQARDLQLLENGIRPHRATEDIDFAIMPPDVESLTGLKEYIAENGFKVLKQEPYRIIHIETDTIVDILPFGAIEKDGVVKFPETKTELSVAGMKEVNNIAQYYHLAENLSIQVAPLHGIFVLKLISWHEKPERIKDLDDLNLIVNSYWDIHSDRIYENYPEVFEDENFDTTLAAAKVLGNDIAKDVLSQSKKLNDNVIEILNSLLLKADKGKVTFELAFASEHTIENTKNIIQNILDGIHTQ